MYFRLTPVCFFSANANMSSTSSRGKWSTSRTEDCPACAAQARVEGVGGRGAGARAAALGGPAKPPAGGHGAARARLVVRRSSREATLAPAGPVEAPTIGRDAHLLEGLRPEAAGRRQDALSHRCCLQQRLRDHGRC